MLTQFVAEQSAALAPLISELQGLVVREDSVRLGGRSTSDPSLESEYQSFLAGRLMPLLSSVKERFEHSPVPGEGPLGPFFGNSALFSQCGKILELVKPNQGSLSHRSNARLLVLELIAKMTVSFEPGPVSLARHIGLCSLLWDTIESDCEENVLVALKAFLDLYRSGQVFMDAELSTRLHRFVAWLRNLYAKSVGIFESAASDLQPVSRSPSSGSVKVLKECPLVVQLLTQVFSGAAESYLAPLVSDMIQLFGLNEALSERARQDASVVSDFSDVQVRTLTFIAYVGRSSRSDVVRLFDQTIAKSFIKLLRTVPTTNLNVRRELLLNLRSYLHSPELCVSFVPYIDELFDESVSVGPGRSSYEVLRPIVISTLADFANSAKDKIPLDKVRVILRFFCGTMADGDLPVSVQFTSARIVLNLIDHVFNKSSNRLRKIGGAPAPGTDPKAPSPDGADILREVLRSVIEKVSSLVLFLPKVICLVSEELGVDLPSEAPKIVINKAEMLSKLVGKSASPVSVVPVPDMLIEGVREVRSLIRTLVLSVKMIVHCLTHRVTSRLLTKADVSLLESLLEDGLKVAHLFSCAAGFVQSAGFDKSTAGSSANGGGRFATKLELAIACSVQEERDLIEQLAGVFAVVPAVSLADLLSKRIGWLLDAIQHNSQLMTLCNGIVHHPGSMAVLCEVIYGFLAVKGEELLIGPSALSGGHQARHAIIDPEIDPAMAGVVPETHDEASHCPPGAMRLHPASFLYRSAVLGSHANSLLGSPASSSYYLGDADAVDGAALVSHVMPSLDPVLRVYTDIVSVYGLREQPVKIDIRDVIVTMTKTLSRQVMSFASSKGASQVLLEPAVRPFLTPVTVSCFRVAKFYPSATPYCLGVLRYMFRLMGSGIKTTATIRELSDLVPHILDQCMLMSKAGKDIGQRALWLEIALTLPVRLKSLIPSFEVVVACLINALSLDSAVCGETISAALTVLESWVDGLTPDFFFPLIAGYGEQSLTRALFNLTKPPKGFVVHTTGSGNNSVRATKILGKLGCRAKFSMESSNNVTGFMPEEKKIDLSLLLNVAGTIIDVDLSEGLGVALKLLHTHATVPETTPVCLQEVPVDVNEIPMIPEQELMDALNLVVAALSAKKNGAPISLACGIVNGLACVSSLVVERATQNASDLVAASVDVQASAMPPLIAAACRCLSGDASDKRRTEAAAMIIKTYIDSFPMSTRGGCPKPLIMLGFELAESLVSLNWADAAGACMGLAAVVESDKAHLIMTEIGQTVIERCVLGYVAAEGTRSAAPSIVCQRELVTLANATMKTLVGSHAVAASVTMQDQAISALNKFGAKLNAIKSTVTRLIELFTSKPAKTLAESLIHSTAHMLNVPVAVLVRWVDPEMDRIRSALTGERESPVFAVTAFVLQMRPAPILANPSAGELLHQAILNAITRAAEWLENEDELCKVYGLKASVSSQVAQVPPSAPPQQPQAHLLQREVLKRRFVHSETSATKVIQALRVLKLTLLHTQLGADSQPSSLPSHFVPVASSGELTWRLNERISLVLARSLFSFDYEIAAAAMYSIAAVQALGSSASDQVWIHSLLPLARDVASRAPVAETEVQGLGRLLQLLPQVGAWTDEARNDLAERLFERMHTYLSLLRERTYAPLQAAPVAAGHPPQIPTTWRAGVQHDSTVTLAALTLECFSGLVTDRLPLVERLLTLAAQLDVSLPSTFGSGQICTPFLNPLLASLCRDPERTADQLLTKLELHKVFGFVAELVSLRTCLGLRKALQDKCHQMSLMDTGVLMMRTAAASLISVLARHDPSYLWIQYCSIVMKASMGMPRSVSLIESLIRNWESSIATLTSGGGLRPASTVALGPGGVVGPSDATNSVSGYEGRMISWSVMQFIRAPIVTSPGIVTDLESHLNIRVRLLIRLATSLSLKYQIEVSTIQDWFVNEAVKLTTISEKKEIFSKSVDAFADGAISVGCKFVLLRYLVVPQVKAGLAEQGETFLDDPSLARLAAVISASHEADSAVQSELIRLIIVVARRVNANRMPQAQITDFLRACLGRCGLVTQQLACQAVSVVGSSDLIPAAVDCLLTTHHAEFYHEAVSQFAQTLGPQIGSLLRHDRQFTGRFAGKLKESVDLTSTSSHIWKLFLALSGHLDAVKLDFLPSCLSLLTKRNLATTEARMVALEVALLAAKWTRGDAKQTQIVLTFFVRHIIAGPEPPMAPSVPGSASSGSSAVSPTLLSVFMDKCLEGVRLCDDKALDSVQLDISAIDSALHLPSSRGVGAPPQISATGSNGSPPMSPEVMRHCKQLVGLCRVLNELYTVSKSVFDFGHLAHIIGIAMVSTDKSVCVAVAQLVETVVALEDTSAFDPSGIAHRGESGSTTVIRQIFGGIHAGFTVGANNTGPGGKLRINPLNPNSSSYLVTPYMACATLIAVLRGLVKTNRASEVSRWLGAIEPLLVKAVTQGSRSLVFGLLPHHLHPYALSGTKSTAPEIEAVNSLSSPAGGSMFAYPGVLQGADFAVPSLLQILRLAHIAVDIVGSHHNADPLHQSIMWLIECIGPFLTFASPNQQTFAHLLNGLNFTVPQQSQKLSGAPSVVGGLSNLIPILQLSALIRHCIGIVSRWCLGNQFSVCETSSDTWILDDCVEQISGTDPKPLLVLSVTSSLVGAEALASCCDVGPVSKALVQAGSKRTQKINVNAIEQVVLMMQSLDGLAILLSLSDGSVKRLLGFVPQRSVTCFPGSVASNASQGDSGWIGLNASGLWSSKSGQGGLLAIACETVLEVAKHIPGKDLNRLLPALLVGSVSCDRYIRSSNLALLRSLVPSDLSTRIHWILRDMPWSVVSGRMFLPVMVQALFATCDDRVWTSEADVSQFAWANSLLSLTESDADIAFSVWKCVFGPLVETFSPAKQLSVYQALTGFMTKPFLAKQSLFTPNVAGAILASVECSFPIPVLVYCATHHGLYLETIGVLEAMAQQEQYKDDHEVWCAIQDLYQRVGERDSYYGTLMLRGVEHETSAAIALMAQGKLAEGRSLLEANMKALQPECRSVASKLWLEANKSMSQWSRLLDVANDLKDPELKLEVLGKSNEWGLVADVISQYDWSTKGWSKIFAAYLALSFSDSCDTGSDAQTKQRLFLADMEASINRSFHNLVSEWGALPDPCITGASSDLLLLCQEFVEFSEASGLVTDIRSAITGIRSSYPTPKQLLNSWRDRLPEKEDSLTAWYELLSLRMVIFRHIQQQCSVDVVASSHIAPYLHDYPWSLVKLAQIAGRNGNAEMAQTLLQRFQQSLSRSTDAFNQELFEALQEQIKLYIASGSEDEYRIGLNVLNCCAISNSNSQQAAEISWMQGRLMRKLGMLTEAKTALVLATNTYPMIASAWVDTGDLLYDQLDLLTSEQGEECLMAYMLAVTLKPSRATRLVPRILLLAKRFSSLAEKAKDSQASGVWIFWVNILVKALTDGSLRLAAKNLLLKIAVTYPQSVYFAIASSPSEDAAEILAAMKESKPEFVEQLAAFSTAITSAFPEVNESANLRSVAEALEDLRHRRASSGEIKSRISDVVKGDPSESNLVKWIKAERQRLSHIVIGEGFLSSRIEHFVGALDATIGAAVEMLGNYTRIVSVLTSTTVESVASVKVAGIANKFEFVNEMVGGIPIVTPRITLIGSNGLHYDYLVKSAGSSASASYTGQQMYALINALCQKYSQTKQRGIAFNALQQVPLGNGMVIEEAPRGILSLDQILSQVTGDVDCVEASVGSHKKALDSSPSRNAENSAFEHMIGESPDDLLENFVDSASVSSYYGASKRFTKGMALASIVDQVLGIDGNDRSVSHLKLGAEGRVFVSDFDLISCMRKVSGHSHHGVPFRLTSNIVSLIGERNLVGLLPACMRAVADCLDRKSEGLVDLVDLVRSMEDATLKANVRERISALVDPDQGHEYRRIIELITESMDQKNLANVQPRHWLPWI